MVRNVSVLLPMLRPEGSIVIRNRGMLAVTQIDPDAIDAPARVEFGTDSGPTRRDVPIAVDVGIDVAATVARQAAGVTRAVARFVRPVTGVARRASSVAGRQPAEESRLAVMAQRGARIRAERTEELKGLVAHAVPAAVNLVLEQVDVAAIAQRVIDSVDLPEIIRESSSSVASATVVDVRMRGIKADERLTQLVDRLVLRRRQEAIEADPHAASGSSEVAESAGDPA